jgi:hypothetical protein
MMAVSASGDNCQSRAGIANKVRQRLLELINRRIDG